MALRSLAELCEHINFEGFHFHLGGYNVESRAQAVRELADVIDEARRLGLAPRTVDIGGGLPIRYVDSAQYDAFLRSQGAGHYRNDKVPSSFYPYGSRLNVGQWLDLLLESPCRDRQPIARWLNVQGLRLAVEPGRNLADQLALLLMGSLLLDLALEPTRYGIADVLHTLLQPAQASTQARVVVWDLRLPACRLPRASAALGMALGVRLLPVAAE